MYKSEYYSETHAKKSNSLTSAGIAVAIVLLGIFAVFQFISVTHDSLEGSIYSKRCSAAMHRAGISFSDVSYLRITEDEPAERNSRVYLFKVTNLKTKASAPIADAFVKCELSEVEESWDKYVSYNRGAEY